MQPNSRQHVSTEYARKLFVSLLESFTRSARFVQNPININASHEILASREFTEHSVTQNSVIGPRGDIIGISRPCIRGCAAFVSWLVRAIRAFEVKRQILPIFRATQILRTIALQTGVTLCVRVGPINHRPGQQTSHSQSVGVAYFDDRYYI